MASRLDVYNFALSMCRAQTLDDPDDTSESAGQCRLWEDQCRRMVLKAWPWAFARKRSALTLLLSSPANSDQWAYQFQLPTDLIRIVFIGDSVLEKQDFERRGFVVLTNAENTVLHYIYDVTNYGNWPDDAVMAMAAQLAVMIAPRVATESPVSGVRQEAQQEFAYWLKVAAAADGNEQRNDRDYYGRFKGARSL